MVTLLSCVSLSGQVFSCGLQIEIIQKSRTLNGCSGANLRTNKLKENGLHSREGRGGRTMGNVCPGQWLKSLYLFNEVFYRQVF